jgi:hypothetical protein
MVRSSKETAEYVYYTLSTTLNRDSLDPTFDIEVGDEKVEFIQTDALTGHECAPI